MAQDFYADADAYAYRGDRNPVDADQYGYMTYGVPMNRDNVLFYPATGIGVPDSSVSFGQWADQQSYQYTPPMVRYCLLNQQPRVLGGTNSPKGVGSTCSRRSKDLKPNFVGAKTAMFSEQSNPPMTTRFANPIPSPEMHNHFDSQCNTSYTDRDIVLPSIPMAGAFVASSLSSSATTQTHVPPTRGYPEGEPIALKAESEPTTDSLPLRKLTHGMWKCLLCDQELRRKQRAIAHYWSKHSNVRLNCSGGCGSINCNKSFTSQDGLDVHLNPILIDCSLCGRSLLKKNILRHRDQHCHAVETVS